MTQYKRIGIDRSKSVFTLHGIDGQDRPILRTNLRRAQMNGFLQEVPSTRIAMKARGAARHWACELIRRSQNSLCGNWAGMTLAS